MARALLLRSAAVPATQTLLCHFRQRLKLPRVVGLVYKRDEVSILLIRRNERRVEARMRAEGTLAEGESLYGDAPETKA